ncbi:MAG: indolepyruvate oxidoreductase subunit beta [Candidatus Woesearchaeota archaeon]
MKILVVGVGGQGILLASNILGKYAMKIGFDIKISEVHGMAQRGGSVITQINIDKKVYSPLIEVGKCDILLAFEKLEALRWKHYLKKDGMLIINNQSIIPTFSETEYPKDIINNIDYENKFIVDGISSVKKLGSFKVLNTLMLGKLTKEMNFDYKIMRESIIEIVPKNFKEINIEAYNMGYSL